VVLLAWILSVRIGVREEAFGLRNIRKFVRGAKADFKAQGIDAAEYLNHSIFLHYSGRRKPWYTAGETVERAAHGAGDARALPADARHPKMLVELAAPWHDVMRRLDLPLPPPPARCRRRARGTCSSRSRAQVPEPSIAETAVAESYYGAEKGHGGAARRRGTPSSRSHLHPRAQGRRGHAGEG